MTRATVGPYAIVRELGTGAVGRVSEALDPATGRRVAIKTLLGEHATSASQRLLLDEAAIVIQLSHPHVVELLDVGRDEAGSLYLVMELVDGSSLSAWSRRWPGALAAFRACDELLDALSAAHAQGIIHGDLKPGNVLLDPRGGAKITDFGIARIIDPIRRLGGREIAGTPLYMAPEQLFEPEEIGPWTDLYAVGVMLRGLFGADREERPATLPELVARKQRAPPPFAPRDGLRVPEELCALLDRLVHPDPRQRPRFAANVRRELALLAARSVEGNVRPARLADDATWMDETMPTSVPSTPALSDRTIGDVASFESSAPDNLMTRLRPVPLVGRAPQIATLLSLSRAVTEGGDARAMLIVGRAGEGKSRVARHGLAAVESDGSMLGAAASYDEENRHATGVDLRACIRRLLGPPRPGSTVEETLGDRWAWLAPAVAVTGGVDLEQLHWWLLPEARPIEAAAAARLACGALRLASRICPVYLWLDDVGWSQDGARELVALLLEADARVLVVGTLRTGTADHPAVRAWLERVAAHPRAKVQTLPPLRAEERGELVAALGVEQRTASRLGEILDEPTLVVVQAVRDWMDRGLLVESPDGRVPVSGVDVSSLAASARGVIGRRLDAFLALFGGSAPAAERVLVHAALLGLRFEERALRRCCDADVDAVLDRALLVGLLRVEGPGVYRFDHQLFAEALTERLRGRERADAAELYRATGRALLELYGVNVDTTLHAATLLRKGGDRDGSASAAVDAVRVLARVSMNDEATKALSMLDGWLAEDATPDDHPRRAEYFHARGLSHYYALRYQDALADLRRARDVHAANGNRPAAQGIMLSIAAAHLYDDDFAACARALSSVLDQTDVSTTLRARACHAMATLAALRRDFDQAALYLRAGADLRASEDAHMQTVSLGTLAELLAPLGAWEEAEQVLARLREILRGNSDRFLALDLARTQAIVELTQGDFARAQELITPRLASVTARGAAWYVTGDRALVAVASAAGAEPSAAERAVRAFIAAYQAVKHDEPMTWWCIRAAEALLRGRGMAALADELGVMLDDRLAEIDAAFAAPASGGKPARKAAR